MTIYTNAHTQRIQWSDIQTVTCIHLASYGFHCTTIAKSTGLSESQVYYRLRSLGIKLKDYRNGLGTPAVTIIRKFSVDTITNTDKKRLTTKIVPVIERKLQERKHYHEEKQNHRQILRWEGR